MYTELLSLIKQSLPSLYDAEANPVLFVTKCTVTLFMLFFGLLMMKHFSLMILILFTLTGFFLCLFFAIFKSYFFILKKRPFKIMLAFEYDLNRNKRNVYEDFIRELHSKLIRYNKNDVVSVSRAPSYKWRSLRLKNKIEGFLSRHKIDMCLDIRVVERGNKFFIETKYFFPKTKSSISNPIFNENSSEFLINDYYTELKVKVSNIENSTLFALGNIFYIANECDLADECFASIRNSRQYKESEDFRMRIDIIISKTYKRKAEMLIDENKPSEAVHFANLAYSTKKDESVNVILSVASFLLGDSKKTMSYIDKYPQKFNMHKLFNETFVKLSNNMILEIKTNLDKIKKCKNTEIFSECISFTERHVGIGNVNWNFWLGFLNWNKPDRNLPMSQQYYEAFLKSGANSFLINLAKKRHVGYF